MRDIRGMMNVSGEKISRMDLEEWVQRLGVAAEWKIALAQDK